MRGVRLCKAEIAGLFFGLFRRFAQFPRRAAVGGGQVQPRAACRRYSQRESVEEFARVFLFRHAGEQNWFAVERIENLSPIKVSPPENVGCGEFGADFREQRARLFHCVRAELHDHSARFLVAVGEHCNHEP